MTKNKPLLIIVFFLLVSILIAIYFQFTLVKRMYIDKKTEIEYEFIEFLEHALYLVDNERGTLALSHDEFHANITSYIVKSCDYDYEMNNDEFDQYNASILEDEESYKMTFKKEEFPKILEFLKKPIADKKLKVNYDINFLETFTYKGYETLRNDSDLLIAYSFGAFSIQFTNEKPILLSEMKNIVLSSLFFIVTMSFCGTILIKKYLNEKRLSIYKNEFINNLTHELQTPLTVSKLALEKLNIDLKDDEKLNKYVSIVEKENGKIEKLAKRILKLAELKTVVSKNEKIDISKSIQNAVTRHESLLAKEDVLLTDLNHLDVKLKGSKERFLDLIDNLLSNAIKYSKPQRSILLKTSIKNGKLHLSVKDNGIGIPEEFEDKIFTPFFKVPKNDTHEVKSHGLGLSYVAEIVNQMNGEISMSSELNKGTTFNIILPYED